tara:strand:- start:7115 stop:7375 length:261 start_codon:yes stop_codon:yes gene_type:complete
MKHALKTIQAIKGVSSYFIGWIALISIQELIKSKVENKQDRIHLIDGNADNYIELDDFLERNQHLPKDHELIILINTAIKLLKYGS